MNEWGAHEVPAYGVRAASLLADVKEAVMLVAPRFVDHLYATLYREDGPATILSRFDETELAALRMSQVAYLQSWLEPGLSESEHQARARQCGELLAMLAVECGWVVRAMREYASALTAQVGGLHLDRNTCDALRHVVTERANAEIHFSLLGANVLQQERQLLMGKLLQRLSHVANYGDRVQAALDGLMDLNGLRAAAIAHPDPEGTFIFERMAGDFESYLERLLAADVVPRVQDRPSVLSQGPIGRCWRTGAVATVASYATEPLAAQWKEAARSSGFGSGASIPLRDVEGRMLGVLTIYGSYPGMFETTEMQTFLELTVGVLLSQAIGLQRQLASAGAHLQARQVSYLRQRVYAGEVTFHGQPIVDLHSRRPVAIEFLARLHDQRGKTIGPGTFLPCYGRDDLIRLFKLGLDYALTQARRWDDDGLSVDVSVNLPPELLIEPAGADWVADALQRHRFDPARLKLELLEDRPYGDKERHDAGVHALAALGVGLAMDDLGSGYSSLLRLSSLPFHTVKIDQGLVRDAGRNPDKIIGFIGSLINLGKSLDLTVVVEGLETMDLVEAAAILGADAGQGYALARPMPVDGVAAWARSFTMDIDPVSPRSRLGLLASRWRCEHTAAQHVAAQVLGTCGRRTSVCNSWPGSR